jgi:hypothetical protein
MNDIFYYCCIINHNKSADIENNRQQRFNNEIATAMNKFEVIHQQLTNFIGRFPTKEDNGNNINILV